MVEIKNNFSDFADKLKGKFDLELFTPPPSGVKRRMISPGVGGRPRKFAGVVTGQDVRSPVSSDDFSGVVNLGQDLPSFAELARREEAEKQKKPLKTKNKIPLPPPKNPRDGRPDDLPGR